MTRSGRVEADPSDVLAPTFASIGDFRDDAIHVPAWRAIVNQAAASPTTIQRW